MKHQSLMGLLCLPLMTGVAQAALINITTGSVAGYAVYDDVTDLTWMTDANLAASNAFSVSGINSTGSMDWDTAQAWIAAMNTANYLGFSDWRLPVTNPINGSTYDYSLSNAGDTDFGENISAPGSSYEAATNSELAYMFYNNLDGVPFFDLSGAVNESYGLVNGTGPFINVDVGYYWSSTEFAPVAGSYFAFNTVNGDQSFSSRRNFLNGWAVRSGYAGVRGQVPLPGTLLLIGLGALGSMAVRRWVW